MSRSLDVRRTLAATAALVIAGWGAAALPASADQGNGNGNGHGNGHSQSQKDHKQDKKDKGHKGDKSNGGGNGNGGDKTNGGGNGNGGDKSNGGGNGKDKGNKGGGKDKGDKGGGGKGGDKGDPAGNNGTVKITPVGQDDGIPQNNPHVECGFDIEWYGFDKGDDIISKVTLEMHSPTKDVVLTPGGPSTVFVGEDAAGGGTDFDGEATYYPTFDGAPHPQQGYHIKLTINTPGSQGADTKHKVFWVEPCTTTPTPETDGDGGTDEPCVEGEMDEECEAPEGEETDQPCTEGDMTEECDDDTVVEGEESENDDSSDSASTDDSEVMGAEANAAGAADAAGSSSDVPNAVDAGGEGNPVLDFVRSPIPLLIIGLGALLAALAFASRRRNTNV